MTIHFRTGPGPTLCGIPVYDTDPGFRHTHREACRHVLRDRFEVTCKRCRPIVDRMAAFVPPVLDDGGNTYTEADA